MDSAEKAGLGVAVIGHAVLFGLLSVGFLATPNPLKLKPEPVEVTLTDEMALQSASPTPLAQPPESQSPEPSEIETPSPPMPQPTPQVRPEPQPRAQLQPQPKPRPQQRATPAKQPPRAQQAAKTPSQKQQAQPKKGRLGSLVEGMTDKPRAAAPTGAPAATIGPAQRSALSAEIRRQLKPHWKAPSGADAELLKTELAISLAADGSVTDIRFLRTTGVNDSNRAQMQLHRELAIKAVKLASPFRLPPALYAAWKTINPVSFDRRL